MTTIRKPGKAAAGKKSSPRPKGTDWGAINLSLPAALHRQLATSARSLGEPVSQCVAAAIELWSGRVRLGARRPAAESEGKRHEFCISLPRETYALYEELRGRLGLSRSQAVAEALPIFFAEVRAARTVAPRAARPVAQGRRAASA